MDSCPYFTGETNVNNGYGCNHAEQEETDVEENGHEQRKCYCWSCPLGYPADMVSLNEKDIF